MRPPDRFSMLEPDCAALAWMAAGKDAAAALARLMGADDEALEELAEVPVRTHWPELTCEAWRLREGASGGAGVGAWLIHGPFHPAWSWWGLLAVHLRPQRHLPPPKITRAGATHEILICSLNPDREIDVDAIEAGTEHLSYLTPIDLVRQVRLHPHNKTGDRQAAELLELMAGEIIEGRLSPDSDYASLWERTIDATAEHLREGGHK